MPFTPIDPGTIVANTVTPLGPFHLALFLRVGGFLYLLFDFVNLFLREFDSGLEIGGGHGCHDDLFLNTTI